MRRVALLLLTIWLATQTAVFADEILELDDVNPARNEAETVAELDNLCPGVGRTDYAGQLAVLDKALNQDDSWRDFGNLKRRRASAYFALGKYQLAADDLTDAIPKTDGFPHSSAILARAQVYAKMQRYEDALADCNLSRQYLVGSAQIWGPLYFTAKIYSMMGNAAEAERYAKDSSYMMNICGFTILKPYSTDLLKLSNGKVGTIASHRAGLESYLETITKLAALTNAPSNQELNQILKLENFPGDEHLQLMYHNKNLDSLWGSVMRNGHDYTNLDCNAAACSILPADIERALGKKVINREPMKIGSKTIEFSFDQGTGPCNTISLVFPKPDRNPLK